MTDASKADGLGEALKVVEILAKQAAGEIALENVELAEASPGLPNNIVVAYRSGPAPQLSSVRALFEEYRTAPERREGVARVRTLRSFIELTRRHKDVHTALFAQAVWPNPSLTAVIDYHQLDGVARFGRHRVHYDFPLTPEFATWVQHDGQKFSQAEFAEFVENNIMDLAVPLDAEIAQYETLFRAKFAVPTDLVALSRSLEINVDSKVKSAFKLESGEAEIKFETEHRDARGEPVHVPGLFLLSTRAFVDGAELRLPARLRYRVKDGGVTWTYHLYKWGDALRQRVATDLALAAKETGLPAFEGAPEAAAK